MSYSLSTIEEIKNSNYFCELDINVLDIINNLTSQVSAKDYVKKPCFDKKKRRRKTRELSDEDWNKIINFEATKKNESIGIDKIVDELRVELNKLTNENYTVIHDLICDKMSDEYSKNNLICNEIFKVCTSNPSFSNIYAKLYFSLITTFKDSLFLNILNKNIDVFADKFNNIVDVDDKNYDDFCKNNRINDNITTFAKFIANMSLLIDDIDIQYTTTQLQTLLLDNIDIDGKTKICEELSNAIFVIFETCCKKISSEPQWEVNIENIKNISKIKLKTRKSFSSKVLFKHFDIIDLL